MTDRDQSSQSADDEFGIPDDTLYVIYSIGNSSYQEWQADLLDYSFDKAGQPGTLIRIVSEDSNGTRAIYASAYGFTVITPDFSRFDDFDLPDWPVMNKPGSLKYFFDGLPPKFKERNASADLLFLDPDMIFVEPWDPRGKFDAGEVYGQTWIGYGKEMCRASSIEPEYCPESQDAENGPIMFPFAIKLGDMDLISDDIAHFAKHGYIKQQGWMVDMPAFVTAIEKHGLKNRQIESLGLCNNWANNNDAGAPIMHYCQSIRGDNNELLWAKTRYNNNYQSGDAFPPAPSPTVATNRVDREVLKMLNAKISEQHSQFKSEDPPGRGNTLISHRPPRIIWTAWLQGAENQPIVVKECIKSWVDKNPSWQVNVIDERNVSEHIDFDLNHPGISRLPPRLLSDIIRLQLLHNHGGVWTDSTTYCNRPLDGWIDDYLPSGFFSFDAEAEDRLIAGWFIAAVKDSLIVKILCEQFTDFLLTDRSEGYPYYLMQQHFRNLVATDRNCAQLWQKTSKLSPADCLRIYFYGYQNIVDDGMRQFIDSDISPLHKLTYKLMLPVAKEAQTPSKKFERVPLEKFPENSAIRYLLGV